MEKRMAKKVYELANEIGVGALDLVEKLKSMGFSVRNHMASLSAEEEAQARAAFEPAGGSKTAAPPKKTAVRKVIKREASETSKEVSPDSATVVVQSPTVAGDEEAKPKTVTVKRKSKAAQIEEAEKKAQEKEEKEAQALEAQDSESVEDTTEVEKPKASIGGLRVVEPAPPKPSAPEAKAERPGKKKVYVDDKPHTFTPVFVPEEKDEETNKAAKKATTDSRLAPRSEEDEEARDKKRMGELATAAKKAVVPGSKGGRDLTMLRAEEEMKVASQLVGKTIYTIAKKKKVYTGPTQKTLITEVKESKRVIEIHGAATASELAQKLSVKFEQFANKVLDINLLVRPDDYIGVDLAGEIAALWNYRVEDITFKEEEVLNKVEKEDKSNLPLRNPIITIMGHVDHGKTSLLDYIRKEKVASGEAGGITQHIGAYSVKTKNATLTFLDTPGHAAFAAMRQRGANVTDIVVLVVAADDGVMPQTVESIKFCRNAGVPIIVAVNKIDKPTANPDKVKQGLMEFNLLPEDWGGDTQYVHVSAHTGEGIDNLLESIGLQAEIMELRENPKGAAEGVVIESKVEIGRGPVATILVQKGTLSKGDAIVVGETYGRARSLMDFSGKMLNTAGPSTPVQILGLSTVPSPGDIFNVVKNEREAQKIVENRINERKELLNTSVEKKKVSLEDFFATAQNNSEAEKKILNLIIRSDVQGSYEAIVNAVEKLGNDEVSVSVIGGGVGAITDNDVNLASSTGGFILGFNMRPVTTARRIAEEKGVDIKTYSIIYELINDVTLALEGMLTPEKVEKYIGRAQVRDTFSIPKVGTIAGTAVIDGKIERGCSIRLLRDGKIIYDGRLSTLKRFKDEVKEVKNGYECGMALENFNDIKVDDLIEAYIMEDKKRTLSHDMTL